MLFLMLCMSNVSKEAQNTIRMKSLCPVMMTQSNYIMDSSTKYSNYMVLQLKFLNYNKI